MFNFQLIAGSEILMATKRALSQHSVRQCTFSVSAKASDILRYFSSPPSADSPNHQWSTGLIYFRGYPNLNVDSHASVTVLQEVIALYPVWLLDCQTVNSHRVQQLRTRVSAGLYQIKSLPAGDFFSQLQRCTAEASPPAMDDDHTDAMLGSGLLGGFQGGLAGFIGYDLATDAPLHTAYQTFTAQGTTHDRERHAATHAAALLGAMGDYDIFLRREVTGWSLYGPADEGLQEIYQQIGQCFSKLQMSLDGTAPSSHSSAKQTFNVQSAFKPIWHAAEYRAAYARVQQYLRAGDCYQVNLTQPFIARVEGALLDTLDDLMTLTQAPYSSYMRVGEHELLSCSPELFLAFTGHQGEHTAANQVVTRPIKGTFPRSADPALDLALRNRLAASEKDHSENLMIVDLLRNDLSKHAQTGSVLVPTLFAIESFAQVHHLVSEVRATLAADASPLDVLLAALPGGSITGAPKKRAMEIIAELEAAPRGGYCGSMGYLNHDGSGQFNILIRTLQKQDEHLVAWAGGGITVASDVDAEYQECFDKIKAILDCINQFKA
jgi:para-aminobenzoate synthetase component 1